MRRTVRAFEAYDHVVVPSGSCAAMVRQHYGPFEARVPGRRTWRRACTS